MCGCLVWPLEALGRLVALLFELSGRFIVVVSGMVLIVLGVVISLTVIGAIVGIPMLLLGFLLVVRGLF